MAEAPLILLVDDDAAVRRLFAEVLVQEGFRVAECADGLEALARTQGEEPAVIILDVEMPRLNGWKTLAELRRRGWSRPILMVTHVGDVDSRVHGLEAGADDYLVKPCSMRELLARVRAVLRRAAQPARSSKAAPLRFGDLTVDLERKTASREGVSLRLTRTEYALLAVLREQAGRPVSREILVDRVWGGAAKNSHALDTHLWRLRRKLGDTNDEARWIRNLPGIGYVLSVEVTEAGQG